MFFEGRLVVWLMVVLDVGLGRATGTLKRRLRCVALRCQRVQESRRAQRAGSFPVWQSMGSRPFRFTQSSLVPRMNN